MDWTEIFWNCDHKGDTLPQVLFKDPDWFFYMIEKRCFEDKGPIAEEARDLNWKARHILIPGNEQNNLVAEYSLYPPKYLFVGLKILSKSQETDDPDSERKDVIDLSYPRQRKSYDKYGNKLLIEALKTIFYGSKSYKMTRKRCEAFFENERYFEPRG